MSRAPSIARGGIKTTQKRRARRQGSGPAGVVGVALTARAGLSVRAEGGTDREKPSAGRKPARSSGRVWAAAL